MTIKILSNIGDPIIDPHGTPLLDVALTFNLVDIDYNRPVSVFDVVSGELVSHAAVIATTDIDGIFTTALWPNNRGDVPTVYKVTSSNTAIKTFFIIVDEYLDETLLSAATAYGIGAGSYSLANMPVAVSVAVDAASASASAASAGLSVIAAGVAADSAAASSVEAESFRSAAALLSSQAYVSEENALLYMEQSSSNATFSLEAKNSALASAAIATTKAGIATTKANETVISAATASDAAGEASTSASNALASKNSADADAIATAADRVQTGLDRTTVSNDKATVQAITVALTGVSGATSKTLSTLEVTSATIDNVGQTENADIQLPSAAAGMNFLMTVGEANAYTWRIRSGVSDKIYLNGEAGVDNGYVGITSPAVGAYLSVYSFKTGASSWDWMAVVGAGNWAVS